MPLRLATPIAGTRTPAAAPSASASRTSVHASRPLAASPYSKQAGNTHLPLGRVLAAPARPGTKRCCVSESAARAAAVEHRRRAAARRRVSAKPRNAGTMASSLAASAAKKSSAVALLHAILRHVAANAFAELLRPQPLLEHREHRLALRVGDAVERGADFGVLRHRLAQLARASRGGRARSPCVRWSERHALGHCGRSSSTRRDASQDANDSLSQRSFHQGIVT